ncbi:MAG: EAL domain-containing protein, partial [Gammaproteobacteria bacterium]|nr:EAL domain-containing protein [Gammaproteobacteria bacterium]
NKSLLSFLDASEEESIHFSNKLSDLLVKSVYFNTEEVKIKTKHSASVWVEVKLKQLDMQGDNKGIAATIDNINERKQAQEKLQHLALHDTLTGLYNRYSFDNELSRLTLLAARGTHNHCLLYIDLDHFKIINDTEGHQTGDLVLKEVAAILSQRLRKSDVLCRVGGDEFVILLVDTQIDDAVTIGNNICKQIADAHFHFGKNSYKISASIGVSEVDGNATGPEYLRQADIALYVAKNKGRNRVHCYTEDDAESKEQHSSMQWAHRLQEAVVNDNIELHFQPIWDVKNNKTAYFEALVRLKINGKLVYPGEFITALERAEDINMLDHQVVSKTIKMLSTHPVLHKVAINLSAQAFSDEGLVPLIKSKLEQYNVSGTKIIFELTESASLTNVSGTIRMIEEITELGCQFSIDDFGTGFSTFAYLRDLPAQSVKIDGSFVKGMHKNSEDLTLVKAISNIAIALGKECVAEFVENREIYQELEKIGVHYAQGYFISRPMPVEQLVDFTFEI